MSTLGTLAAESAFSRPATALPRSTTGTATRAPGLLTRILTALVADRSARAERFVRPYLARLGEDELRGLGHSPADIARIKQAGHDLPPCWM